jgi:hypothetical protein
LILPFVSTKVAIRAALFCGGHAILDGHPDLPTIM